MKTKQFLILSFSFLILSFVQAEEHWRVYRTNEVPWDQAQAIASIDNKIFVSGTDNDSTTSLWVSPDGESWQPVIDPNIHIFTMFIEHNNKLYGFDFELTGATTGVRHVFRYDNGTWVLFDKDEFGAGGFWSDVVSYDGHIYATDMGGQGWRSKNEDDPVLFGWDRLGPPFIQGNPTTANPTTLAKRANELFIGMVDPNGIFDPSTDFYSSTDGQNWNLIRTESGEEFRSGSVQIASQLYWAANFLWEINSPVSWSSMNAGILPVPFDVDGILHVFTPASQIFTRNAAGQLVSEFEDSNNFCATSKPRYEYATTLGNKTFVLPCTLMALEKGIFSLDRIFIDLEEIKQGERDVPVLSWEANVNSNNETQTELTITNIGTAIDGRDIAEVSLYQSSEKSPTSTLVTPLFPHPDGKSWSLPAGFSFSVLNSRVYFVAVTLSENAQIGATVRLSIQPGDLAFTTNSDFDLHIALTNRKEQVIVDAAPAPPSTPIEKAIVYPQPAKDDIRFMYSLSSTSEVRIKILDQTGYEVDEIVERGKAQGDQVITVWNSSKVAEGIYFGIIEIIPTQGEKRIIKTSVVIER